MLLASDVGGTKTHVGLFGPSPDGRPTLVTAVEFATLDHTSLSAIIRQFLDRTGQSPAQVDAACFGVAGPVLDNTARLVNVPWTVEGDRIAREFGIRQISLLNDLAAMAYAVPTLRSDELVALQPGSGDRRGNAALIAAGTGLGQALLHEIQGRFVPSPSEGGHADFAPRTPRELDLTRHLINRFGRVDVERVVSGPGIVNLYEFTHERPCGEVDLDTDPSEVPRRITDTALAGRCPRCQETLDLFIGAYGAEAGNMALRYVATAGVYVGGGIAPKILPALEAGPFIAAFRAKGPFTDFLARIPVAVILNREVGLLGAAVYAQTLTESGSSARS